MEREGEGGRRQRAEYIDCFERALNAWQDEET